MYPESEMCGCDCDYLRARICQHLAAWLQIGPGLFMRPCPQLGQEKVIPVTNEMEISCAAPAKPPDPLLLMLGSD